jgi:Outer membrane protein beta-barrel family/Carboxypeptidase regulatory-like domain
MPKAGAILVIGLLAIIYGYGQNTLTISGVIRDNNGNPLSKATLQLTHATDTFRQISAENGGFVFYIRQAGVYNLRITMQGYKSFQKTFSMDAERHSLILPPIVLLTEYEELSSVIITRFKPITILEDTVEYHAAAYRLRPGAELERLMRQLPGIDWDTGGNIIIEGKQVTRLMINGQNYVGGDIKTALRNLPSDIIEKVQVIDDYGDNARLTGVKSGESEKVLNVILKEDKTKGGILNMEGEEGSANRYIGSLYGQNFDRNRQITMNSYVRNITETGNLYEYLSSLGYSNKWGAKWSGNASIDVWGDNHSLTSTRIQDIYLATSQQQNKQTSFSTGTNHNSIYSYELKFIPNPNTQLRIGSFVGIYHNTESLSASLASELQDSGLVKTTNNNSLNSSQTNKQAIGSDLYFETINPTVKTGLSFDVSYRYNSQPTNENNFSKNVIVADSLSSTSNQHYLITLTNPGQTLSAKLNYYIPWGKKSLLEWGYAWNLSTTKNSTLTQMPDSNDTAPIEIDSLSNVYTSQLITSRAHVNYLLHSAKINLSLGLNAQPGVLSGQTGIKGTVEHYHYFNFLPVAQLAYTVSPGRKITFDYTSNSTPPSIQQLNPIENITNPQYPIQGNPGLRPSLTQSASLHYMLSSLHPTFYQGLEVGVSYTTASDMIATNPIYAIDTSTVVQKTTYVNLNGSHYLAATYQAHLPAILNSHLQIQLLGNINYSNTPVLANNVLNKMASIGWGQNINLTLNIPNQIEAYLMGNYTQTITRYNTAGNVAPFSSFHWLFSSRHELLQAWVLTYTLSQAFTSGPAGNLITNPILMNASIQRELLKNNQLRIAFAANNLFDITSSISQSVSPGNVIQNSANQIGRHFLLTVELRLEKFRPSTR